MLHTIEDPHKRMTCYNPFIGSSIVVKPIYTERDPKRVYLGRGRELVRKEHKGTLRGRRSMLEMS